MDWVAARLHKAGAALWPLVLDGEEVEYAVRLPGEGAEAEHFGVTFSHRRVENFLRKNIELSRSAWAHGWRFTARSRLAEIRRTLLL